jgi:hypothetical protein
VLVVLVVLAVAVHAEPGGSTAGKQRALNNDERAVVVAVRPAAIPPRLMPLARWSQKQRRKSGS